MSQSDSVGRQHLPIPDPQWIGVTTYDAKDPDTKFPPIEPIRPPDGAPNVLIVMLDDVGFGASSAFGGPCNTPTFDKLAGNGLKYTKFHTTALCSPTRAALLGGRNHHSVGMGGITEIATSAPGYNSMRPRDKAPIAEVLKLNGYSTAHFGKCHEVPVWETSPMGPFDRWPSPGNGFEHFYGFIGGETNQYAPAIYRDTVPVEPDRTPEEGYHFTEDMTDRSIEWVRQQKALMPDKPFFMYYAPGATHAPHHVPTEWSDKYKGKFDDGWDAQRERTIARQKELGCHPRRRRAHRTPRRDSRLGRHGRPSQAGPGPSDGGLRRVHGAHRPPRRKADRRPRGDEPPRRHPHLRDHRRQRRLGRRHPAGVLQRDRGAQRCRWSGDHRVRRVQDRRVRHPDRLQPLCRGLGPRHGHPLPVDQAGRLALGWHPERDDRPLAGWDRVEG